MEAGLNIAITWAQRAQAELGAKERFRILGEELGDHQGHPTVLALVKKARDDEKRHAIMCAEVAKEYGHSTGFEKIFHKPIELKKSWNGRKDSAERLLCEMTLMCCITETLNASLLNSIYGHSKEEGGTHEIIREILKDEIKHGQIGWGHLSHESQKRDCSFLGDYLDEMLDISVRDELFLPVPDNGDDEDSFQYGVMPMGLRLKQFKTTLEQVVLPGFEQFGVETSKARDWLSKKQG